MKERAHVHCFTGTGNTARAAELIAVQLRSAGYTVTLHRVGRDAAPAARPASGVEREALGVFCFPIYACGIPDIMVKYLRRLPRARDCRAAVICTMGDAMTAPREPGGRRGHIAGFEGHALRQAAGMLRRRGYDVFLTDACGYPLGWTQVVSAPRPEDAAELLALGDSRAAEIGRRVVAGTRSIRRFRRLHALWTVPFDGLFKVFGRRALGKLYVADSDCNACGLCVRGCPARAIRLVGRRPRWNWSCQACQRCINTCPKNAIQTSWLRVAAELVHMLLPIPFLVWRLGPHPWVPVHPLSLEVLFWLGAYAVFTWALDEVVFLLGRVPGIGRIVEWSLSKRLRRYLEPHFRAGPPPAGDGDTPGAAARGTGL